MLYPLSLCFLVQSGRRSAVFRTGHQFTPGRARPDKWSSIKKKKLVECEYVAP